MTKELPPPIGAGAEVTRADLTPGRLIERWTEPHSPTRVSAPMPCHERQRVTIDPTRANGHANAVCRACSETFELELVPDSDGGHFAFFTVAYIPVLLSRATTRKDT